MTRLPSGQLPRLPFVGSAAHLLVDPVGLAVKAARVGPVAPLRIVSDTVYLVNHPDGAKHVLMDNAANFSKQARGFGLLRKLIGDGLLTSDGDVWKRHRRIIQPAFAKQALEAYARVMAEVTTATLNALPVEKPVDINAAMLRLSMLIIGECMLGTDFGAVSDVIRANIDEAMRYNQLARAGLGRMMWWRRPLEQIRADLDRVVLHTVEQRRSQRSDRRDFLTMLLEARDTEDNRGLDDREVRDEILTMFVAGHESTATMLTWALHFIATHPILQERLIEEADTESEQPALLIAVLKETLRLRPPFWLIGRRAREADSLCDVAIDAGSRVTICPYNIHRHPDFWVRAETFEPERHLNPRPQHRCAFIPFGAGKRACIGEGMAMREGQLVISAILRRFRIRAAHKRPIRLAPMVTLRPKDGLPLVFERRL